VRRRKFIAWPVTLRHAVYFDLGKNGKPAPSILGHRIIMLCRHDLRPTDRSNASGWLTSENVFDQRMGEHAAAMRLIADRASQSAVALKTLAARAIDGRSRMSVASSRC
jgi:hypothetical protein